MSELPEQEQRMLDELQAQLKMLDAQTTLEDFLEVMERKGWSRESVKMLLAKDELRRLREDGRVPDSNDGPLPEVDPD